MPPQPTLIVISGPPGAGQTMLAPAISRAVGCPAVCRGYGPGVDEIVASISGG
jgi:SpoVK/Ycf46/Vps4 family AAA+-type ATPase